MRTFPLILLFISFYLKATAQELNCSVQVLSSQIQTSDKRVYETLRSSIYEFMNNRKWTNDVFKNEERIECSILINISDKISIDEFKGTIQIQLRRPIINSSYNSLLLNFSDNDLHFRYLEYDPLEFSESSHLSNLSSILAFYAYIIIGLDYDSFSLEGGTPYFLKAKSIVSNAQNADERGWKAYESLKNRYWLAEDLLKQIYKPYRECLYKYHRHGLDPMSEDVASSRMVIADCLKLLEKVHVEEPSSFILQIFFDAKADELVNIFSESYLNEKTRVVNLLNKIDPANTTKYQKILEKK
ncbi:MAG: DUF4835 family protein [Bacteroidota bacterium]